MDRKWICKVALSYAIVVLVDIYCLVDHEMFRFDIIAPDQILMCYAATDAMWFELHIRISLWPKISKILLFTHFHVQLSNCEKMNE